MPQDHERGGEGHNRSSRKFHSSHDCPSILASADNLSYLAGFLECETRQQKLCHWYQTTTAANRISWPSTRQRLRRGQYIEENGHVIDQTRSSFTSQQTNCRQNQTGCVSAPNNRVSARHISIQLCRIQNPSTFLRYLSNILGFLFLDGGVVRGPQHEVSHFCSTLEKYSHSSFYALYGMMIKRKSNLILIHI